MCLVDILVFAPVGSTVVLERETEKTLSMLVLFNLISYLATYKRNVQWHVIENDSLRWSDVLGGQVSSEDR